MERRYSSTSPTPTSSSSERPETTRTEESRFVDSAVDTEATGTPSLEDSLTDNQAEQQIWSPSSISQSLADRLLRLAASVSALGQDDITPHLPIQDIETNIRNLEIAIEDNKILDRSVQTDLRRRSVSEHEPENQREELVDLTATGIDSSSIFQIYDDLTATVASMRLRQQEQRHLHQLTVTKLEAVAQKYLWQGQQMQDLVKETTSLRIENQTLGLENDRLREIIAGLEFDASQKAVAVSAMTSAVAGLEGWIDDANQTRVEHHVTTTPNHATRQRRAVIRGKGRFRGRYYVDDDQDGYFPPSPDARDLHEGVKAWIRGFRDVEDACSTPTSGPIKESYRRGIGIDDDDWGEFESPASPAV